MTGEMSREDLFPEEYPLHFAVVKEFGGSVEPFDVYQGPYVALDNTRYFLHDDDGGPMAAWWCEGNGFFSKSFHCGRSMKELLENTGAIIVESNAAFADLRQNGGNGADPFKNDERADGTLALLNSLAPYICGDDIPLPREQFLRMVADRITDDLPIRPAERVADMLREFVNRWSYPKKPTGTDLDIYLDHARAALADFENAKPAEPVVSVALLALAKRLESKHAAHQFVAKEYTKADLIAELIRLSQN